MDGFRKQFYFASFGLVGWNLVTRLSFCSRSSHQTFVQGRTKQLRFEMERCIQGLVVVCRHAGDHASTCGLFFFHNKFSIALSILFSSITRKSLAEILDLGNDVFRAIHRIGIFLSRLHDIGIEKTFRILQHFHNDDSLLHDSFRKTNARNHWCNRSGFGFGNFEYEKSFHFYGCNDSLQRSHNYGFVRIVEEGIFLNKKRENNLFSLNSKVISRINSGHSMLF